MSNARAWSPTVALAVLACVFAVACGEAQQAERSGAAPTRTHDRTPAETGAEGAGGPTAEEARGDAPDDPPRKRPASRSERSRKRFNAAVEKLPIRSGPLPIAQYITRGSGASVVARLEAHDFFCARSPEERTAAVKALYERAARRFRTAGVDFRLVVAELTDRLVGYEVYARADEGSVTLTAA